MALIKLNYELAVKQASKIEKAGTRCTEVASAIEKQISSIRDSWTGESADALVEQLTSLKKDISKMDSTLSNLANKVRKKAGEIKAIDEAESRSADR